MDVAVFVLHYVQKIFVVEQVQTFASVYLEVCDGHGVFFGQFEQFLHELFLKLVHREGFARARLPIGKAGHDALFGEDGQQWAK